MTELQELDYAISTMDRDGVVRRVPLVERSDGPARCGPRR